MRWRADLELRDNLLVIYRPLNESRSMANRRFFEHGIAYTEHTVLGGHPVHVHHDPVKIIVRSASRKTCCDGILRSLIFWYRLLQRIQQNGIDAWGRSVHFKEAREFRCRANSHCSGK